ncbi:MAG: peptidoglycan DD-metalloendopeptidase family protein [Rhodospirillaceae bacterium]
MRHRKSALFATAGLIVGSAAMAVLASFPSLQPTVLVAAASPTADAGATQMRNGAMVTGPRSAGRITNPDPGATALATDARVVPSPKPQTGTPAPDGVLTLAHAGRGSVLGNGPIPGANRREVLTVARGDTLLQMLVAAGVERTEAHSSIEALRKVWDPRSLRPGDQITVSFTLDHEDAEKFQSLSLEPDPARRVLASRDDKGEFAATEVKAKLSDQTVRFEGTIDSSLYLAATAQGVSPTALAAVIQAFSYDVDFQRDFQPGDQFAIMLDRKVTPTGQRVGEPVVTYASLTLSGKKLSIYRYEDSAGDIDYFDEKGHSVRKALLRTPINGARLSSGFGKRKHPVLGYSKMHRGVDFAAATGTPIFAAGDGVVEKAGAWGAYGNYVRIRHNSTFDTAYAHMSRFAKGMKAGKRVRQGDVIGYVGSTGRSTGPHLHYEILKKGGQVNPLAVTFPSGRELEGKELKRFAAARQETERLYSSLPKASVVAEAKAQKGGSGQN